MTQSSLPSRWVITSPQFANDPDIFPLLPGFSFITSKEPNWSTGIQQATSGRERRRQQWSYPLWSFNVAYEVLRDAPSLAEQQKLLAFFNSKAGQYQEFFFYDPSDNSASGQRFGTGDGATTTFQLNRTIGSGALTFTEPVRALASAPAISVAGSPTSAFNTGSLGQITFTSPPAAGAALTWSGSFMFLVRFADDKLTAKQLMNGLWSADGINLIGVKS